MGIVENIDPDARRRTEISAEPVDIYKRLGSLINRARNRAGESATGASRAFNDRAENHAHPRVYALIAGVLRASLVFRAGNLVLRETIHGRARARAADRDKCHAALINDDAMGIWFRRSQVQACMR